MGSCEEQQLRLLSEGGVPGLHRWSSNAYPGSPFISRSWPARSDRCAAVMRPGGQAFGFCIGAVHAQGPGPVVHQLDEVFYVPPTPSASATVASLPD